jgi:ribosomal protein S18 acetylase RimI-like enzyme
VEIRRATIDDLDALVDLHRAFCIVDDHPFSDARARAAFGPLLVDDEHGVVWVTDDLSAYAVLTWGWSIEAGGREAVLDEIFVHDRGQGIGSLLLAHVVDDGERRGLARIFLETESHNARGRQLYERHGFTIDDSVWMSRTFTDLSTS